MFDSYLLYFLIFDVLLKMFLVMMSFVFYKVMGEVFIWILWGKCDVIVKVMGKDLFVGYGGEVDCVIVDCFVGCM